MQNSRWKVICQVCGRELLNTHAKKRWDNLIVCPNDWEPKHPSLVTGLHRKRYAGGEGTTASRSGGLTSEPTDQFVLVCDVYTSMGVAGYGTAGCARAGTYNLTFSPLPPTNFPSLPPSSTNPENPIINPEEHDPFFNSIFFIHNTGSLNDVTGVGLGTYIENGTGTIPAFTDGRGVFRCRRTARSINIGGNLSASSTLEGFMTRPTTGGSSFLFNNGVSFNIDCSTTTFSISWGGVVASTPAPAGIFHWCIMDGSPVRLFINGGLVFSGSSVLSTGGSPSIIFGYSSGGTVDVNTAHVGPIRWTRGQSRYSSGGFSPPSYGPFPTQL
jgi:hypothetical protein